MMPPLALKRTCHYGKALDGKDTFANSEPLMMVRIEMQLANLQKARLVRWLFETKLLAHLSESCALKIFSEN